MSGNITRNFKDKGERDYLQMNKEKILNLKLRKALEDDKRQINTLKEQLKHTNERKRKYKLKYKNMKQYTGQLEEQLAGHHVPSPENVMAADPGPEMAIEQESQPEPEKSTIAQEIPIIDKKVSLSISPVPYPTGTNPTIINESINESPDIENNQNISNEEPKRKKRKGKKGTITSELIQRADQLKVEKNERKMLTEEILAELEVPQQAEEEIDALIKQEELQLEHELRMEWNQEELALAINFCAKKEEKLEKKLAEHEVRRPVEENMRNENDYGLEDELSENSDDEEADAPRRPSPKWVQAAKKGPFYSDAM